MQRSRGSRQRATAWLVGSGTDHDRFLDTHSSLAAAPACAAAVTAVVAPAAALYGWHLLLLTAVAGLVLGLVRITGPRSGAPEVLAAVALLLLQADASAAVALTGGATSALLPLVVVPVVSQAASFRPSVVAAATAVAAALLLAASGVAAALVPVAPAPGWLHLAAACCALLCVLLSVRHLARSDGAARSDALVDALTGTANRRALHRTSAQLRTAALASQRAAAEVTGTGVIMIDVDHFKAVNDEHGHERGDLVLRALCDRLRGALRPGDALHRVGGEEFVVLATGCDLAACAVLAERLRAEVARAAVAGLPLTVSAGVACLPAATAELGVLMALADRALYAAKEQGRDRVRIADGAVVAGIG